MGEKIDQVMCKKCGREYNPSMDFVEDYDMIMSIDYFADLNSINELCPECVYELSDMISEVVKNWELDSVRLKEV